MSEHIDFRISEYIRPRCVTREHAIRAVVAAQWADMMAVIQAALAAAELGAGRSLYLDDFYRLVEENPANEETVADLRTAQQLVDGEG